MGLKVCVWGGGGTNIPLPSLPPPPAPASYASAVSKDECTSNLDPKIFGRLEHLVTTNKRTRISLQTLTQIFETIQISSIMLIV